MTTVAPPAVITLTKAVSLAARLAPMRASLPVCSCILLEPRDGGIRVRATNLEAELTIDADGEIDGAIAVQARHLAQLLRHTEGAALHVDGHQLKVTTDVIEGTLYGYKAEDFPPAAIIEGGEPVSAFDRTAFAWCGAVVAQDDSRPILTGVCLNKDTGAMGASDGFRLRVYGEPFTPQDRRIVLPARIAPLIPADASLVVSETRAQFTAGPVRFTSQVIQGTFPDFVQLLPKEHEWRVTTDPLFLRPLLAGPLALAGAMGSDICRITKKDDDHLLISAHAEEYIDVAVTVPAKVEGNPKIAFNFKYLFDVLRGMHAAETLTIEGVGPSDLALFRGDESRIDIVMPMFVQWPAEEKKRKKVAV